MRDQTIIPFRSTGTFSNEAGYSLGPYVGNVCGNVQILMFTSIYIENASSRCEFVFVRHHTFVGRGSSIGSVFAWHASGPEFDPHVRHILS